MSIESKKPPGCSGCKWLGKAGDLYCCVYFDEEDHGLRGCPPGVGCIRKETGKRKTAFQKYIEREGKLRMANRKISDRRMELYEQGLTDRQIANEIGRSEATVKDWRKKRGLSPNGIDALRVTKPKEKPAEEPAIEAVKEPEIIEEHTVVIEENDPDEVLDIIFPDEYEEHEAPDPKDEKIEKLIDDISRMTARCKNQNDMLSEQGWKLVDLEEQLKTAKEEYDKLMEHVMQLQADNDALKRYLRVARNITRGLADALEV